MIPLPFIRLFALSNALFWHFQPSVFSGSPPLAACDKPIKPSSAKSACITFPVFRTLFLTFCPRQAHKRPFASIFAHVSSRFVRRRGRREIFPPFARYIPIYSLYHYCVMIIKINTGIPEGKKERTNPSANKPSFLVLAHRQVRQMSDVRSVSTIGNYKTALRSLERFLTIEGKNQASLTRKIVVRYDHWLAEGGVSSNTRSCYLRSLRALYNRVGGSRRRMDLFAEVFTGNAPTPKRALSVAEIRRVRSLDMTGDWQRQLAQDVFLFSLYAMGMPFVDIAMLRWNAIEGGNLTYRRQKTGAQVCVHLEPCMRRILQRWRGMNGDRLFPLVPDDAQGEEAVRLYRAAWPATTASCGRWRSRQVCARRSAPMWRATPGPRWPTTRE